MFMANPGNCGNLFSGLREGNRYRKMIDVD